MNEDSAAIAAEQLIVFRKMAASQEGLRVAFIRFLEFLIAKEEKTKPRNEKEAIAWLMEYAQSHESPPALREVARLTGIPRRRLSPDRWPRFRETYDRLVGLHKGVDRARMVTSYEEEE